MPPHLSLGVALAFECSIQTDAPKLTAHKAHTHTERERERDTLTLPLTLTLTLTLSYTYILLQLNMQLLRGLGHKNDAAQAEPESNYVSVGLPVGARTQQEGLMTSAWFSIFSTAQQQRGVRYVGTCVRLEGSFVVSGGERASLRPNQSLYSLSTGLNVPDMDVPEPAQKTSGRPGVPVKVQS